MTGVSLLTSSGEPRPLELIGMGSVGSTQRGEGKGFSSLNGKGQVGGRMGKRANFTSVLRMRMQGLLVSQRDLGFAS